MRRFSALRKGKGLTREKVAGPFHVGRSTVAMWGTDTHAQRGSCPGGRTGSSSGQKEIERGEQRMATCEKCGKSGFTLKVDSYSLCEDCQLAVRMELEKRALAAEKRVEELADALQRANEIIEAKDDGLAELHHRAEALEAEVAALEARKEALEADCEAVLKATNAQLAELLRAGADRFDKYAESPPEPKIREEKKKKEKTVKRSRFPLVSPTSLFARSQAGYVVLDLVTTGIDSKKDRIIEIGAIKVRRDRSPVKFSTFVNPGVPIDPAVTAVNGITDEMVANAPSEGEAMGKLVDFIGELGHIVAHNAPFETDFLMEACLRSGEYLNCHVFDILRYCRDEFPGLEDYTMETIAHKFGVRNPDPNRALGNAETVAKLMPYIEEAFR